MLWRVWLTNTEWVNARSITSCAEWEPTAKAVQCEQSGKCPRTHRNGLNSRRMEQNKYYAMLGKILQHGKRQSNKKGDIRIYSENSHAAYITVISNGLNLDFFKSISILWSFYDLCSVCNSFGIFTVFLSGFLLTRYLSFTFFKTFRFSYQVVILMILK